MRKHKKPKETNPDEAKTKKKKRFPLIITIAAIAVLGSGGIVMYRCVWTNEQNQNDEETSQKSNMASMGMKDAKAGKGGFGNMVSASGTTAAGSTYQTASLSGMVLVAEEVYVAAGDEVVEGDKLLKVTDESLESANEQLRKLLASAQNSLAQAKADYASDVMDAKSTYQDSVTAGSTAKDNYEAAIDKLQSEADKAKETYENAKKVIKEYPDKITENKTELKSIRETLTKAKTAAASATKDKSDALQLLNQAETANNQAQSELSGAKETAAYIKNYMSSHNSGTGLAELLTDAEAVVAEKEKKQTAAAMEYANAKNKLNTAEGKSVECDAALTETQNRITVLNNEIRSMQTELSQASGGLDEYKVSYSETKTALSTGKVTASKEYEESRLEAEAASTEYEATCDSLEASLREKQDAYDEANNNLEQFEACVGDGYIYASQAGTISSISCKAERPLTDMMPVVGYYKLENIDIAVSVDQSDIADIAVGDTAMVTGDTMIQGTVSAIETSRAESSVSDVYYTVTVSVDNTDKVLETDTSVTVMFGMQNIQGMNKEVQ